MIEMAKKNPYVFTIGFDETDPSHVRAAEILNGTKKKAQLIAAAILSYVDGIDSEKVPELHLERFQPFLRQLIQKELEKVMKKQSTIPNNKERQHSEPAFDLTFEEKEPEIDESIAQNIMVAMDTFRKN